MRAVPAHVAVAMLDAIGRSPVLAREGDLDLNVSCDRDAAAACVVVDLFHRVGDLRLGRRPEATPDLDDVLGRLSRGESVLVHDLPGVGPVPLPSHVAFDDLGADLRYGVDVLDALRAIPDESVDMCGTSPPYFRARCYDMDGQFGQEDDLAAHILRLVAVFREVRRVLKPDGALWINVCDVLAGPGYTEGSLRNRGRRETRNMGAPDGSAMCVPDLLKVALVAEGFVCRNDAVWRKPQGKRNPGETSSRLRHDVERMFLFGTGKRKTVRNHFEPQRDLDSCVWDIFPVNCSWHPAPFPVELPRRWIELSCAEGGVALDPFCGSGTTAEAAVRLGRKVIAIDLDGRLEPKVRERLLAAVQRKRLAA